MSFVNTGYLAVGYVFFSPSVLIILRNNKTAYTYLFFFKCLDHFEKQKLNAKFFCLEKLTEYDISNFTILSFGFCY